MLKKNRLLPIDVISYGYILFNLIYITAGRNRVENPYYHILAFTLILAVSFLIIYFYNEESGRLFTFIRHSYPLFFISYYFSVSTQIDTILIRDFIDPYFQQIDAMIFGYQPSVEWGKQYGSFFLQELFHFAYFSYYLVIPLVTILIYFKKYDYFPKYVFTVSFVFFLCFITYSLFPVVGGRYWDEIFTLTMTPRGGIFTRIMAFIYTMSQHKGAAFPSSHVAITIVINFAAYKYSKSLGRGLVPLSILLSIATVYCHYHYFIDVVFGIIYAFVFFKPAEKLYEYLNKRLIVAFKTKENILKLET